MEKSTGELTPERFWEIYSKKIDKAAKTDKSVFYEKYKNNSKWTKEIIKIAQKTIKILLRNQKVKNKIILKADPEYFHVDLVGYLTHWPENKKKKMPERQHVWNLKVAYEHENSEDWSDELCKLCYIAADLRVIHSYIEPNRKKKAEEILQVYIDELKYKGIITRIPKNNWLFIFGTLGKYSVPHLAFKLDELKVVPIRCGEKVIPARWKPTTN